MKRFAFAIMTILLMFSLAACSVGSEPPAEWKDQPAENSTQDTGHSDVEGTLPAGDNAQDDGHIEPKNGGGADIILNMNGTNIHARLYDNTAADAFLNMLPYTVTVSRVADDLCGSVSELLPHDPAEDKVTWVIGEIGWFTILCDNEDGMPTRTRTIIGKIDEEDISVMQAMTGRVEIKITLNESLSNLAVSEEGT